MSQESNFAAAQAAFAGKIRTYARHAAPHLPGYGTDDIEQELLCVLWRCVVAYDPNKGATFNTFAQRSFQNAIASLVRAITAQKRGRGITCHSLDVEAVAVVADQAQLDFDAADLAILRIQVQDAVEGAKLVARGQREREFRNRLAIAG